MGFKRNPMEEAIKSLQTDSFTSTELKKDSGIIEGIKQLQDFKHIFSVTKFSAKTAILFSMAKCEADFFGISEMRIILEDLAVMNLSIDGKRADQIVNILIAMNSKKKKLGQNITEAFKPESDHE